MKQLTILHDTYFKNTKTYLLYKANYYDVYVQLEALQLKVLRSIIGTYIYMCMHIICKYKHIWFFNFNVYKTSAFDKTSPIVQSYNMNPSVYNNIYI